MKFKVDFNLSAWIQELEIEASSEEECKLKLRGMPIEDLIEDGYVKAKDITDLDLEVVEATYEVNVHDISFNDDDLADTPALASIDTLNVRVTAKDEDLYQAIEDAIFEEVDYVPVDFDYDIIKKY